MNQRFAIDPEKFVATIRLLRPSPSILMVASSEQQELGPARSFDVLVQTALNINPNFKVIDFWTGFVCLAGLPVLYSGFTHQTAPIQRIEKALTLLSNRKDLVLQLINEEFAVVPPTHPGRPTYVFLIRGSRDFTNPAVLGFENVYIVELPQVDLWEKSGIAGHISKKHVALSSCIPRTFASLCAAALEYQFYFPHDLGV